MGPAMGKGSSSRPAESTATAHGSQLARLGEAGSDEEASILRRVYRMEAEAPVEAGDVVDLRPWPGYPSPLGFWREVTCFHGYDEATTYLTNDARCSQTRRCRDRAAINER